MEEGIMMLLVIAVIIIIIIASNVSKKKKSQHEKKEMEFLFEKACNCSELATYLPDTYFYRIYFGPSLQESEIPNTIDNIKGTNSYLNEAFDFVNQVCDILNNISDNNSVFFQTEKEVEDHKQFVESNLDVTLDEKISHDIIISLHAVSALKWKYQYYYTLITSLIEIRDSAKKLYPDSLLANEGEINLEDEDYKYAKEHSQTIFEGFIESQWQKICTDFPHYNTNINYTVYKQFASSDEALKNWNHFWIKTFTDIEKDLGINEILERLSEHLKNINIKYSNSIWYNQILGNNFETTNFNKYSSIFEIQDFSTDEADRIVKLYQNGGIKGEYRKSKDPKYNGQINQ